MSDEVKQEPDEPDDASPGSSTQSGTGDMSPDPEEVKNLTKNSGKLNEMTNDMAKNNDQINAK